MCQTQENEKYCVYLFLFYSFLPNPSMTILRRQSCRPPSPGTAIGFVFIELME
jgi:hypothetical protein